MSSRLPLHTGPARCRSCHAGRSQAQLAAGQQPREAGSCKRHINSPRRPSRLTYLPWVWMSLVTKWLRRGRGEHGVGVRCVAWSAAGPVLQHHWQLQRHGLWAAQHVQRRGRQKRSGASSNSHGQAVRPAVCSTGRQCVQLAPAHSGCERERLIPGVVDLQRDGTDSKACLVAGLASHATGQQTCTALSSAAGTLFCCPCCAPAARSAAR